MSTFKDLLRLLVIFVAYGITGRMDYEDAVALEQVVAERNRLVAECPAIAPTATHTGDGNAEGHLLPIRRTEPSEPCSWPEP